MSQTVTLSREEPAIELQHLDVVARSQSHGKNHDATQTPFEDSPRMLGDSDEPPPNAHSVVEHWNKPKGNIGRLVFAFWGFLIAGMNDAAIGVSSQP